MPGWTVLYAMRTTIVTAAASWAHANLIHHSIRNKDFGINKIGGVLIGLQKGTTKMSPTLLKGPDVTF